MHFKILVFFLFFPAYCFSQLDSLKGPVKSINEYYDKGNISVWQLSGPLNNFGQFGLNSESIFHEFSGKLFPLHNITPKLEFYYDKKSQLIKIVRRVDYGTWQYNTEKLFSYDEYGRIIQEKTNYPGKEDTSFSIINKTWLQLSDSLDHLISELEYNEDPNWYKMRQYFYDDKARLMESNEYYSRIHDIKIIYHYNSTGQMVLETINKIEKSKVINQTSKNTVLKDSFPEFYRNEFSYNPSGQLMTMVSGCNSGKPDYYCHKTIYEYNGQGLPAKKYFYVANALYSRREYTYNIDSTISTIYWYSQHGTPSGNSVKYFYVDKELVKAVLTEGNNSTIFSFKYKIDRFGNWIEQKMFVNGEPIYTRKRIIAYWD